MGRSGNKNDGSNLFSQKDLEPKQPIDIVTRMIDDSRRVGDNPLRRLSEIRIPRWGMDEALGETGTYSKLLTIKGTRLIDEKSFNKIVRYLKDKLKINII